MAYMRLRKSKREELELKFQSSKVVKKPDDIEKLVAKTAKKGKLTKEEQELVDKKILNAKALLGVPPKIRARWVRDAYTYKPPYVDKSGDSAGRSTRKPYLTTYGAGSKK